METDRKTTPHQSLGELGTVQGTVLLISPYWREKHRWMVSSVKLAELWQRLGYRVVVACMGSQSGVEQVSPSLTIHRRRDFFLSDPWNYGIALGFTRTVRRLVRQERPDLIVVNKVLFWTSIAILPLRLRGHRVVVLTDALVGITWWPRGWLPRLCARLYAWTLGWVVLLCAHRVVLFHPQPESVLQRLGIAGKTRVIPTGIDTAAFQSSRFHVPGSTAEGVTITYIGRLESVKGVDDLLAAFRLLRRLHPNTQLQIVGWHTLDHPLVQEYGREASFVGLRQDIPMILAVTDIFVLPSYSEGLSNALMEAMASGCACVASEVGGNRFLLQNGVSGFLFPPGDREALAAHLRRLIEDPVKRRQLGEAARERIRRHFGWEVVGEQYERLFREVVSST